MDALTRVMRYCGFLCALFVSGVICGRFFLALNSSPNACVVDKYYASNAFNSFYYVVVESPSSFFGKEYIAEFRIEVDSGTYGSIDVGDCVVIAPARNDFAALLGKQRIVDYVNESAPTEVSAD